MSIFLILFDAIGAVSRRFQWLEAPAATGWWKALIEPYYVWGLLAVTIILPLILGRVQVREQSGRE